MAQDEPHQAPASEGSVYRVAGTINITRAATTQREIDALPDPLTIDLSDISRMPLTNFGDLRAIFRQAANRVIQLAEEFGPVRRSRKDEYPSGRLGRALEPMPAPSGQARVDRPRPRPA